MDARTVVLGRKKTDYKLGWNYLVSEYKKNFDAQEDKIQTLWESYFAMPFIFNYSDSDDIDSKRSLHIGSKDREIPGIFLRSNHKDICTIELKCTTCDGGCTGCTSCTTCDGCQNETGPKKLYTYGCSGVQTGGFEADVNNSCTGGGNSTEYDLSVNPPPPGVSPEKWLAMSQEERIATLREAGIEVIFTYRDPKCPPAPALKNLGLEDANENGEKPNVKTGAVRTKEDGKTYVPYYDAETGEYLGEMVYDPETGEWNGEITNPVTGKKTIIKNAKDDGQGNFTGGTKETQNPDGSSNGGPANPSDTTIQPWYTPPSTPENPNPPSQPGGCF